MIPLLQRITSLPKRILYNARTPFYNLSLNKTLIYRWTSLYMTHQFTGNSRGKTLPNYAPRKTQGQDAAASSSKPCNNSSGPGQSTELTVEDISNQDINYDADIEFVRPYEYEEADDESPPSSMKTSPTSLRKLELDGLWSSGLVESMSSLHCNPREGHRSASPERRGRKRKLAASPDLHQTASAKHPTVSYFPKRPSIRPKKPKKRHNRSSDGKLPSLKPSMSTLSQTDPMDTD